MRALQKQLCSAARRAPLAGHCDHVRRFHAAAPAQSGHSRWSTIKHDKAKNDASKNRARSVFSQEIYLASKLFGPDPNANPRLSDLITKAKKSGYAKASIEAAIARGQGKSLTGLALESVTIEAILPGNIGLVVDCETDNRARTLQHLRLVIKRHGGNASPSNYLFEKRGKVVFERREGLTMDDVLTQALEVGALDVHEGDDGPFTVITEVTDLASAARLIGEALEMEVSTSEVVWMPNEDTLVPLSNPEQVQEFAQLVDDLNEGDPTVRGVYMNVGPGELGDDEWARLTDKISV